MRADVLRHATIKSLGNAAGYASHRVGISTEGDRVANGLLETVRLEECDDRLRHRALAGNVEAVSLAQVVEALRQVMSKLALDQGFDVPLLAPRSRQENGC